jgi:putative NADH-flavin reductase
MAKILVLGASGPTGQQVVAQALERGHEVTALVRGPGKLTVTHDRLRLVTGTLPDDGRALGDAMQGQAAVISTLGVGRLLKPNGLIARSMPVIVQAMEAAGVRRLVFTSAYGVGETARDLPIIPRILIRLFLRDIYADKAAGEEILRRSSLEWTLVYPVTLTNGPRTGRYRVGERLQLRGLPAVSRADVADLLLGQVDDGTFVRRGVLISP